MAELKENPEDHLNTPLAGSIVTPDNPATSRPRVLAFGVGALMRGLVLANMDRDKLAVHVVARRSPVATRLHELGSYTLVIDGRIERISVDAVHFLGEDDTVIADLLRDHATVAVVTSVGPGQADIAAHLARYLSTSSGEPQMTTLVVIACENRVHQAMRDLGVRSDLLRRIDLLPTMVDRICTSTDEPLDDPAVYTETFAEWQVQPSALSGPGGAAQIALLEALGATPVSDIFTVRYRKTLMLNGLQGGVAANAMKFGMPLPAYLTTDHGRTFLKGLSIELAAVVALKLGLRVDDVEVLRETYVDRVLQQPDSAERILKLQRPDYEELRATVHERIRAPLAAFEAAGRRSIYIRAAVEAIDEAIARLRASDLSSSEDPLA